MCKPLSSSATHRSQNSQGCRRHLFRSHVWLQFLVTESYEDTNKHLYKDTNKHLCHIPRQTRNCTQQHARTSRPQARTHTPVCGLGAHQRSTTATRPRELHGEPVRRTLIDLHSQPTACTAACTPSQPHPTPSKTRTPLLALLHHLLQLELPVSRDDVVASLNLFGRIRCMPVRSTVLSGFHGCDFQQVLTSTILSSNEQRRHEEAKTRSTNFALILPTTFVGQFLRRIGTRSARTGFFLKPSLPLCP